MIQTNIDSKRHRYQAKWIGQFSNFRHKADSCWSGKQLYWFTARDGMVLKKRGVLCGRVWNMDNCVHLWGGVCDCVCVCFFLQMNGNDETWTQMKMIGMHFVWNDIHRLCLEHLCPHKKSNHTENLEIRNTIDNRNDIAGARRCSKQKKRLSSLRRIIFRHSMEWKSKGCNDVRRKTERVGYNMCR